MHVHAIVDSTSPPSSIWRLCLVPKMLTSIAGQASSISQRLRTAKKALQDVFLDVEYVWNDEVRHTG